jgi:hypothetical protein
MVRVLICGSRHWQDRGPIESALLDIHRKTAVFGGGPLVVIHGAAEGADRIAQEVCDVHGIACEPYPAEWAVHAKGWCRCAWRGPTCLSAGPRRNERMLREGKPGYVIAFHDDISGSRGTRDMVNRARRAGIPTRIVSHDEY